jgi:hypothetical protein
VDVYYEVFCPEFHGGQVITIHSDLDRAIEALEESRKFVLTGETLVLRKVTREVLEF